MNRLLKDKNAEQNSSNSSNPSPHGIGGSNRQILCCFIEKGHAAGKTDKESTKPPGSQTSRRKFCFTKAKCEPHLKQSGDYQIDPAHNASEFLNHFP